MGDLRDGYPLFPTALLATVPWVRIFRHRAIDHKDGCSGRLRRKNRHGVYRYETESRPRFGPSKELS